MIRALQRAAGQEENPLWLIVLCDMMTNLMLFFLVMFALTQQGPQAQKALARTFAADDVVDTRKPELAEEAVREFREEEASRQLQSLFGAVAVTEDSIRVRLRDQVLFPFSRAELAGAADKPLTALARVLREMPNDVVIEGHTDDVPVVSGAYRNNRELSVARAYSFIERLVREGVPPERLIASGYGEFHPTAPNDSPASRTRNRRVEVVILRGRGGAPKG